MLKDFIEKGIPLVPIIYHKSFIFFMKKLSKSCLAKAKAFDIKTIANGKSLLIIRRGGIGDLLFISPIIHFIKQHYPFLKISLMCQAWYHSLFVNSVDRLLHYSWKDFPKLIKFDYIVFLDEAIEQNPLARKLNIYDLLAKDYFGLSLPNHEKKPVLKIDNSESIQYLFSNLSFVFRDRTQIFLALHVQGASPIRTPLPDFWVKLINLIVNKNFYNRFAIFLIGNDHDYLETIIKGAYDLITEDKVTFVNFLKISRHIIDFVTLIELVDIVIGIDSAAIHIAAAKNVPAIGIYGPFPSALRTKYYSSVISFDAKASCAPCFIHGHEPCPIAKKIGQKYSPCFNNLSLTEIAASVEDVLKKMMGRKKPMPLHLQQSETSKFRVKIIDEIKNIMHKPPWELQGIEIGSGQDPLIDNVVSIDLPRPYTKCGNRPIIIRSDGRNLSLFADDYFDFLYSSHLFEDFDSSENLKILQEWVRIIKPGGLLVLLLPDQKRYEKYCFQHKMQPNPHHKIADFGVDYVMQLIEKVNYSFPKRIIEVLTIEKFYEYFEEDYNFLIILRKRSG